MNNCVSLENNLVEIKVLMEISFDFVSHALYTDPNMTQFHTYCKICDMRCLLLHI